MNGYVQDERYIAIEHMDVRRDCVNFAQRLTQGCAARLCQFCTASFYLPERQGGVVSCSGHAVNPSMGARTRLPVSHGPETRYHTPSATWVIIDLWFRMDAQERRLPNWHSVCERTTTHNPHHCWTKPPKRLIYTSKVTNRSGFFEWFTTNSTDNPADKRPGCRICAGTASRQ